MSAYPKKRVNPPAPTRRCRPDGATVIACARRIDAREALSAALRENGPDCRAVQMDVTDPASVSRAFEEIAEISGAAPDIGP
jgi:NAD(P)-dependent dehydrogenase (short-subunit alcohol dehydrogenase family)